MKLKKIRNALLVVLTLALVSATTVAITWAYVNQGLGTKDNKFTNSDKINIDITEPNWTGSIPDNQKYTSGEGYTPGDVVTVATGENGEELAQGYYPGKQIPKDPRITNISTASGDGTKEYIGAKLVYQVKLPTGENGAIETKTYPTYADFARLDLEHLKAGARVEFSSEKRNPSDFAVWKWIRDGEDHAMQWEYRGRMGYPGWHIECATIIHEVLGEPIDIHCGGIDHIPIHHTNEIAQLEGAYGKKMSNFWLHNNFITIEGQKISKSLGNVYMFNDLAERGYSHLDYKMWVLQGHFQSERNFSFEDIAAAKQRLLNYRNFAEISRKKDATNMSETKDAMMSYLNNNLNSAGAFAELDKVIAKNVPDSKFVQFLDQAFGLDIEKSTPDISKELKDKIAQRVEAKKAKDYAKADALRDEIAEAGIVLLDGADGVIWQYA